MLLVECVTSEHKDSGLISKTHVKMSSIMADTCKSIAREAEAGRFLGSVASQSSLMNELQASKTIRDPG